MQDKRCQERVKKCPKPCYRSDAEAQRNENKGPFHRASAVKMAFLHGFLSPVSRIGEAGTLQGGPSPASGDWSLDGLPPARADIQKRGNQ